VRREGGAGVYVKRIDLCIALSTLGVRVIKKKKKRGGAETRNPTPSTLHPTPYTLHRQPGCRMKGFGFRVTGRGDSAGQ
jgi:hypothetical protein